MLASYSDLIAHYNGPDFAPTTSSLNLAFENGLAIQDFDPTAIQGSLKSVTLDGHIGQLLPMDKTKVNEWAWNVSRGLLSGITFSEKEAPMLALSGATFKGKWAFPSFVEVSWEKLGFLARSDDSASVDMMKTNGQFQYFKFPDGSEMCELPYEKSPLSMFVLLPPEDKK